MKQKIIPYTPDALRWHLSNNAGLGYLAQNAIIAICDKVNKGKMKLWDVVPGPDIPVSEILDDLKIDYNA